MTTEVVFITGANTGIGLETVNSLVRSTGPYHIFLGARDLGKAHGAIESLKGQFPGTKSIVEPVCIDITDDTALTKAFEIAKSKFGRVDVLINNAGASFDGLFHTNLAQERDVFNRTFDVNVSAPHLVTSIFAPLLLASSNPRLIFLTSGLSSLSNTSENLMPKIKKDVERGWPKTGLPVALAYRSSKAAVNMLMVAWHHILRVDGVKVWCVSPGFLATGLGGRPEVLKAAGAGHPSIGGELVVDVVSGGRDEDVGKIVTAEGVQEW